MTTKNIYSSFSELIKHLELVHHIEGGYYRQNYRADNTITTHRGIRPISTSIYYCLPSHDVSVWHKLVDVEERIHFHYGDSVMIYTIENRQVETTLLDDPDGAPFIVNANTWFAMKPSGQKTPVNFSLMSCICEPGFDYSDLVIADKQLLSEVDREHHELVASLIKTTKFVYIRYKNYQGKIANRRILPKKFWFGATRWHSEKQYLLDALDMDKNQQRSFAMKDILAWSNQPLENGDL